MYLIKIFGMVVCVLILSKGANASGTEIAKASPDQLFASAKSEKDALKKFHALGKAAKKYSSADLTTISIKNAKECASLLLKIAPAYRADFDYGNAVHHANLVLGRLALHQGDMPSAKDFLKKAGGTPGSPQLSSFGPNMTLAKELLEAGEKDVVLQYFNLVRNFWKSPDDKHPEEMLDTWQKEVEAGKIPNFHGNLLY